MIRSSRFHIITAALLTVAGILLPAGTNDAFGGADASYQKVSFQQLKRYKPGRPVPPEVAALNGKNIEVLGFMAALTQLDGIGEFVLASSPPLNCYCAPPLFINEVISVKMNRRTARYKAGVVKVRGKLIVNTNIKDEFNDVMYTLKAEEIL